MLKDKRLIIWLLVAVLAMAVNGACFQHTLSIYISLGLMCVTAGLLVWREPAPWCYPVFLFVASLSLLYMTTLWSPYLIGGDTHLECYLAEYTLRNGWDPGMPINQNSALSVTILLPYLAKALHISPAWVLKAIFPLFFAAVPVLLWFIYKWFMDRRDAFIASLFFISVPTFFFEVAVIGRQQIAEVLLCLFILMLVVVEWRLRWKIPCLVVLGLGVIVSHYSIGGLFIGFLALGVALVLLLKLLKLKTSIPVWAFAVVAVIVIVFGGVFYGTVSQGAPLQDLAGGIPFVKTDIADVEVGLVDVSPGVAPGGENGINSAGIAVSASGFALHSQLMKTALGLDFMEAGAVGKAFRLFQFATQLLLVLGMVYSLVRWWRDRTWSAEYAAFLLIGCGLLVACIFRPGFSSTLNASRFYHLVLIFAAPLLVFGGRYLLKRPGLVAACIILPYFLFTSGMVFEATKQPDVSRLEVPYSVALSSHRIDLWGNFTEDDERVRLWVARYFVSNWVVGNSNTKPFYGDLYGSLFLQEKLGYLAPLYPIPHDVEAIPDDAYIYLRSYGNSREELVLWAGPGLRLHKSYAEIGFSGVTEGRPVLYRSGDAVIWGSKLEEGQ